MALMMRCPKGHSYIAGDIFVRNGFIPPDDMPSCSTCRQEWEKEHPIDPTMQLKIAQLKRSWTSDPSWDIENTDGFEAYRNYLKTYRQLKEKEWNDRTQAELHNFADSLGIGNNLPLAAYIRKLEGHIEALEGKLYAHTDGGQA
jgi:hypothetical protein